jgi:glutathione S-transferase
LRGWLMVKLAQLEVEEVVIPLAGGLSPGLKEISPSGLVPSLEHDGARIWESLSIAEYCAEIEPKLWPGDRVARAQARSMAAEMHAGFRALRIAMPMNLGRDFAGLGQTADSLVDIARIDALLAETRAAFGTGGPYLFGDIFNAADAMFTPVVARFLTYHAPVSAVTSAYCEAVRTHSLVRAWYDLADQEPAEWRLDKYENMGQL